MAREPMESAVRNGGRRLSRRSVWSKDLCGVTSFGARQPWSRLVLTTGWPPACMSLGHSLYIGLFRVDASQTLLWEAAPLANTGGDPAHSRLERGDALVEFSGGSIDSGIF